MSQIRFYFDKDAMDYDLIEPLRTRSLDILTALEAKTVSCDDEDHLAFATAEGRALYSFNGSDYCRLNTQWLETQKPYAGIIVAQQRFPIGRQLRCLLHLASAKSGEEMRNNFEFLSAWG